MFIYVVELVSASVIKPISLTRPEPVCPVILVRLLEADVAELAAAVAEAAADVAEVDADEA
jgi:hypothetical protein